MTQRRRPTRHGLHALRAKVKVAGLAAIDARTVAARTLLDWRRDVIADLGGEAAISAQQRALIEHATRTRLYVDHLDAFLMTQRSLVNARRKSVLPVLRERQTLADSLARILTTLGLARRAKPAASLDDIYDEIASKREQAAGAGAAPAPHSSPYDDAESAAVATSGAENAA